MKKAEYRDVQVRAQGPALEIHLGMENRSSQVWKPENFSLGWQFFDPETDFFILEGEWTPVPREIQPGEVASFDFSIPFPPDSGGYHVYVSPIEQPAGWAYQRGRPFLRIRAETSDGEVRLLDHEIATTRALRLRRLRRALPRLFSSPIRTIAENHRLIGSMARRDILARYRGSFGDVFWTILNPLLLMATYFFVFGVVLRTRFGADQSSTSFALYFLAGMLPWLAFSEPAGRAAHVILEHRNFVKKLIFPLETLPVNQVVADVRDLGQIMGFVLTLWFFITPICYPETSLSTLPAGAFAVLRKNPFYVLVRGYRAIFLEGHPPELSALAKLWVVALIVFLLGHAWFYKLRKSFADVI
jgi:ABC-type polysaccharide/polyol phosphate export permease